MADILAFRPLSDTKEASFGNMILSDHRAFDFYFY